MNDVQYGYKKYDSIKTVGDKILIEKLQKNDLRCIDGIYVPESKSYKNCKIGVGKILDLGDGAKEKYSLNVGDYVLYDYYSAHGDWKETIITDGENIILQLTEQEASEFLNGSLSI
jgi:co-chaperonin GroES (HSP10)